MKYATDSKSAYFLLWGIMQGREQSLFLWEIKNKRRNTTVDTVSLVIKADTLCLQIHVICICILHGVFWHLKVIKMEFGEEMVAIPQGILKRQGADLLLVLCDSIYVSILFVCTYRLRNRNSVWGKKSLWPPCEEDLMTNNLSLELAVLLEFNHKCISPLWVSSHETWMKSSDTALRAEHSLLIFT